jgi:hypothetical protein
LQVGRKQVRFSALRASGRRFNAISGRELTAASGWSML